MEVHILLLSTMTLQDTASNLSGIGLEFDTVSGTIQKLRWTRKSGAVSVSLWVACVHPLVEHMASSFVPHMDACVCWYHDHDGISCLKVDHALTFLQSMHDNVRLMATALPEKHTKHESRIKRHYNRHGFEIQRLTSSLEINIEEILRIHLDIQKKL
jgi:hypothetical protein